MFEIVSITSKFSKYLKGAKTKDKSKTPWKDETKENFEQCKDDLANAALLSCPYPDIRMDLYRDAADFDIGSVMQQFEAGCLKPLSIFVFKKRIN